MEYYNGFGNFFGMIAGLSILILVLWLGLAIGLAFIPASIAKRKGYSAGAFWCLGFFCTFLVGIIVACCIPDRNVPPPWFRHAGAQPPSVTPPPAVKTCPHCGAVVDPGSAFCIKCGAKL